MKNTLLPALIRDPARWGKWLFPAGLIVIAILGFLQLYRVQAVFFPEKYHENEMRLISKECAKIEVNLQMMVLDLSDLKTLTAIPQETRSESVANPTSNPSGSAGDRQVGPALPPDCQAALRAVKKERVFAARKLLQLATILNAIQRDLAAQDRASSLNTVHRDIILSQIHAFRVRCQVYDNKLRELSAELNKFAGYCGSLPTTDHDYSAIF
jgi:hypothetical protein